MRINIYGAPGTGKTSLAAEIFANLKKKNVSVDLVQETAKKWAYKKKNPKDFDQLSLLIRQMEKELLLINSGVKHLITDSPVLLSAFYCNHCNLKCPEQIYGICREYDRTYESIDIFLNTLYDFNGEGRFQENIDEVVDIKSKMFLFLREYGSYWYGVGQHKELYIYTGNFRPLMKHIESKLG